MPHPAAPCPQINEHADQMRQITDAMSQPLGAAADIDEDELLGELEVGGWVFCGELNVGVGVGWTR